MNTSQLSFSKHALGLVALISLSLLTACVSIPKINRPSVSGDPCAKADWFEVGRLDGLIGVEQENSVYVGRCRAHLNVELYTAGWNRGLVEFCKPERGFDAGRSGLAYSGVCPQISEAAFLRAYAAGREIMKLERDNLQIDRDLEATRPDGSARGSAGSGRVVTTPDIGSVGPSLTPPEIQKLRDRRAKNELMIREIELRRSL